jgi:hypothetical protein
MSRARTSAAARFPTAGALRERRARHVHRQQEDPEARGISDGSCHRVLEQRSGNERRRHHPGEHLGGVAESAVRGGRLRGRGRRRDRGRGLLVPVHRAAAGVCAIWSSALMCRRGSSAPAARSATRPSSSFRYVAFCLLRLPLARRWRTAGTRRLRPSDSRRLNSDCPSNLAR